MLCRALGVGRRVDWQDSHRVLITLGGVHGSTSALMAGVLEGSFARMKLKDAKLEPRENEGIDSELLVTLK